jgi:hypothetical protein
MALLKYGDRVREATTTEGSSDYVLEGTTEPLERTFVEGIGDGEWCYYCCEGLDNWEIGYGQIIVGTSTTLTRDTILASSNNDLKVPWAAGSKTIFNTATAAALDHIAGFVINQGNVTFNRGYQIATEGQTTFDHIYIRGSLEVYVDGKLVAESEYSAVDGATVVFNTGLTAGQQVEFIAIGQYTTTHTEPDTPVPTGQTFKSDMFFNDVWRNASGYQDAVCVDCLRWKKDGVAGDGVQLNGTSSKVTLTDFGLDHSAPFTLTFWMETADTLADGVFLSNQSGLDTDGYLHMKLTATGNLVVAVLDDTDTEQTITKAIYASTEYHVALRYDGTDLNLVVNGVAETPLTASIKTTTPTNNLALGYKINGESDFCVLNLAGINIYASSLSDTSLTDIYSEPNEPNITDLSAVVVPGSSVATNADIVAMVIALG